MLLNVCNTDRQITITPNGGAWVPGKPVYTDILSVKTKILTKAMVISRISWNMVAGVCSLAGGWVHGGGSTSTPIGPTCAKVKDINIGMGWDGLPIRLNDAGQCMGVFSKGGAFVFCKCDFVVTDAGQTKVKAQ